MTVMDAYDPIMAYVPSFWTALISIMIVLVCVPFMILWYAKQQCNQALSQMQGGKKARRFRKPKWTLDDPTAKRDMPIEMRGKGSIAEAVKRYADRRDSDSDSDDEQDPSTLTPEQILAQHQEIPREPHVGIFLGVDDPTPAKEEKKNGRCASDARDMAEAMAKLDYRTFVLHDHKSHKTATDGALLPTRMNLAHLLRTLKDGKYDEQTRRKPNLAEWSNCLVYLASRVRITSYGQGKSETLEFLLRQENVVHTGEDDIQFEDGEDMPHPGKPVGMAELLRRTGVMSGIVNSQRCSVVGMTRPPTMPRELPAELTAEGEKVKVRNGPFAHFFLAGMREVEKRDPNAEMWKSLSSKGIGGMGGGFGGMMPTVAPVTSGDLGICPFHCGDMTVDAIYRFMAKKVRLLLKDPLHDPAYHQGCVKMVMAMQKAIRPKDAPDTPAFMHECRREELMERITEAVMPRGDRQHRTAALHGDVGVGKSALMLATAWTKETLDYFSDGVYYFSLRDSLANLRGAGRDPLMEMQQRLAHCAAGFEGMLQTPENGVVYLSRHFAGLKAMVMIDDVTEPEDVDAVLKALGINDRKSPLATVIFTTNSKEVAERCMSAIEVPNLTDKQCHRVMAAAAGLLSEDDLPKDASKVAAAFNHVPLFATMIGSAMRGASDEKWAKFHEQVSESGGDEGKLMGALFSVMPETSSACLRTLAPIPTNRSVAIPALMTFWKPAVGGLDWNKAYAVLAELLDSGCMSMVLEEDYNVLVHPLVSRYLKKGLDGDSDSLILQAYREQAGMEEDCFKPEDLNAWIQMPWDGYYHTYAPEHMHKVAPHLLDKMLADGRWLLSQHDSARVDKLMSDYRRYGTSEPVKQLAAGLESAAPALRRHPWEVIPQMLGRVRGETDGVLQSFCGDITDGARAATPADKYLLWLNPLFDAKVFDPESNSVGSEGTCVGFHKDWVVTGHKDGRVVLWSVRTGKKEKELVGHKGAVHGVVSTASGKLATGSKDEETGSRIRVWDTETGEGEVHGSLPKDTDPGPARVFPFKVSLGRTGTDIRDHDEDAYGGYNSQHIITDTVLVEHNEDSETINCHTFMGWDSNIVATSLTLGCAVAEVRTLERDGHLLVATADVHGRMLLFKLMTNDVRDERRKQDSDSE